MKIIGVIPARWASTRLPGKPLADLCGKPMIQHVYERARQAKSLSGVVVATDDKRIFDAVEQFGGKAVMTSPNHPNGSSRAEEATRGGDMDAIINIQGDEPLLSPVMIDEVAEILNEPGVTCATLCRPLHKNSDGQNPNRVKVALAQNGYALYFSRSLIPFPRNKPSVPVWEHIGIYGYTADFLRFYVKLPMTPLAAAESLEQLKILECGYKIRVKPTKCHDASCGVDTPEDLEAVRKLLLAESRQ